MGFPFHCFVRQKYCWPSGSGPVRLQFTKSWYKIMASPKEETGSPHPSSASDSSDDSDSSQGSGSMVRVAGEDGARVTKTKGKKGDGEPKKEKRRKAKRACRPCQVAHLTCSQSPIVLKFSVWRLFLRGTDLFALR